MKKIKLLSTESKQLSHKAKDILNSFAQVDYKNIERNGVISNIQRYDALLVRLGYYIDEGLIAKAKNLKVIATPTTGENHLDVDFLDKKKISLISLKGETQFLNSIYSTAEHTFGLILSLTRRIPSAHSTVIQGQWQRELLSVQEIHGKTIGIIGFGRLGRMVAKYSKAFGMKIVAYDKSRRISYPKYVLRKSLDEVLFESDIISLHIPFNDSNKNFMNGSRLNKMKKGSLLINTSRGSIIDERQLLKLLKRKHIAGAALDVLRNEEKPDFKVSSNPLVIYAKGNNNLIITPHMGGVAQEAVEKTNIFIAKKLKDYFMKTKKIVRSI